MYSQALHLPSIGNCLSACSRDNSSTQPISKMSTLSLSTAQPLLQEQQSCTLPRSQSAALSLQQQPGTAWDMVKTCLRLRKRSQCERSVTAEEAAWFLSLPEKIRRQHFTSEEAAWLRARSDLAVRNRSNDGLLAARRAKSSGSDARATSSSSDASIYPRSVSEKIVDFREECFELSAEPVEVEEWPLRSTPLEPRYIAELDANNCGTYLSSPTVSSLQSIASTGSLFGMTKTNRTILQTSNRAPRPPPITTEAIYIGGQDNRSAIQDYLSSPQLSQYAFPCPRTEGIVDLPPFADAAMRDDDNSLSAEEGDGPATPDVEPQSLSRSKSSYFPASNVVQSPTLPKAFMTQFEQLLDRDLTLRLTLTRPELRASDEELYGVKNDGPKLAVPRRAVDEMDPLALERLVYSDDTTGRRGVFANEQRRKGLKGLWRSGAKK